MGRLRLTPQAVSDLEEIWFYIAQDNPEAARRTIHRIRTRCQELADMPGMGTRRSELSEGIRSWGVGPYLIFYRAQEDGIEVIHILHGARNLKEFFESD